MVSKTTDIRREKSRNKVLISLQNSSKRFKDLEKETELSPAGLSAILKLLTTEKEIEPTLIDNKSGYKLTKKGKFSFDELFLLSHDIDEIRSRDGKHYRNYSHLWGSIISCGLHWGIESDLTLDKEINKLNLLQSDDVREIEELVFKKITNNIKKKKLNEEQFGKMVLGFSIDYNTLIKSIKENSLTYIEHISKEEQKLLEKMEDNIENMTNKEIKRLDVLRKKTYEKIKNLPK